MPRKSRKKPSEVIDQLPEAHLTTAALLPSSEIPPDDRPSLNSEPLERFKNDLEAASTTGIAWESHTKHARPEGPRKRQVNEPGSIFTGPNIRLAMDADAYMLDVKVPLTTQSRAGVEMYLSDEQQNKLIALGMDDVSPNGDGSAWMGEKRGVDEWKLQLTAVELDGKGDRLARGR